MQEAFLAAWRQAPSYDHRRAQPSTWLLMLVHRRAIDLVRRQERSRALADRLALYEPGVDSRGADGESEIFETRRRVLAALEALPENQRRVIELAYYGGLSQSEVAAALGLPVGTVKSRTFVALAQLREVLADPELVPGGQVRWSDTTPVPAHASRPVRPRASCARAR